MPLIGFIFYPVGSIVASIVYPPLGYAHVEDGGSKYTNIFMLSCLVLMFIFAILGLIFGIVAKKKISRIPNLKGKIQATVGITLSIPLLLYGLFALVGGLFGM